MVPGAHPSAAADFRTLKPRTSESRDRAENVKLQLAVWHGRVDPLGRHQIDDKRTELVSQGDQMAGVAT
jgi:hypothetical protein